MLVTMQRCFCCSNTSWSALFLLLLLLLETLVGTQSFISVNLHVRSSSWRRSVVLRTTTCLPPPPPLESSKLEKSKTDSRFVTDQCPSDFDENESSPYPVPDSSTRAILFRENTQSNCATTRFDQDNELNKFRALDPNTSLNNNNNVAAIHTGSENDRSKLSIFLGRRGKRCTPTEDVDRQGTSVANKSSCHKPNSNFMGNTPHNNNKKDRVLSEKRLSSSSIQSAIGDILHSNSRRSSVPQDRPGFVMSSAATPATLGILGEPTATQPQSMSAPLCRSDDGTLVRIATPMDDFDIANLRLSVFSDFSVDQSSQFCSRSCQAIANRRKRGAVCIVALRSGRDGRMRIHGTAECSFHEFYGTQLGQRRPQASILYITEVAVHPAVRRRGVGALLLNAIDVYAVRQKIETIYLHVDVSNYGAIALYKKCGYQKTDESEPVFEEFTKSLNLQPGATKGRIHHLLFKDVRMATWLPQDIGASSPSYVPEQYRAVGAFGFEIPA